MVYEIPPLICPDCDTEFEIGNPNSTTQYICLHCGRVINLESQYAYSRGLEAFSDGQDIIMSLSPRKRVRLAFVTQAQETAQLYMQAYSSLQIAFRDRLADSQRKLGIEMMASMAQFFLQMNMISPLEAGYWHLVLAEKAIQDEVVKLNGKIAMHQSRLFILNPIYWYRRLHRNQLIKKLAELNHKIKSLEKQIGFVEPLLVRQ